MTSWLLLPLALTPLGKAPGGDIDELAFQVRSCHWVVLASDAMLNANLVKISGAHAYHHSYLIFVGGGLCRSVNPAT